MSDVLVYRATELTAPIVRIEEEEEDPHSPPYPIEPIHALQLFFLPFLLVYFFFSFIIALASGYYGLLVMSGLSLFIPFVGRKLEKKYINKPFLRRAIAIRVLFAEVVLFFIWQINCIYLFG